MDYLRSCYSTDCRFFQDDPRASTIHWYFVEDDTPELPFGTIFTSNEWLDVPEGDQDLGEVPAATRVWQDGTPPFPVAGDGHFCGSEEDFQQGGLLPTMAPPVNVYGGLACCPTPPDPFIFFSCEEFPGGVWNVFTLVVFGATGDWINENGTFTLRFNGSFPCEGDCAWLGTPTFPLNILPPNEFRWIIESLPPGDVQHVTLWAPGTAFSHNYPMPGWNGITAQLRIPVQNAPPDPGVAPFVTLLPGFASVPGPFCVGQGQFLPTSLLIRTPAAVVGIGNALSQQDAPFTSSAACVFAGVLLWDLPRRFALFGRLTTSATLTFGATGLVTLSGLTPAGNAFAYSAILPAWDGTPAALMLAPNAPSGWGLPQAITLYTQSHLPP